MKCNELIIIAEAHGYKHIKHGKKARPLLQCGNEEIIVERHGSQEIRKGLMMALKKKIGF